MTDHIRVRTDEHDEPGDDDFMDQPMPKWERRLVVASLAVHVADVILDVVVLILLVTEGFFDFSLGSSIVVFWAWLASSLYISCGAGANQSDVGDSGLEPPRPGRLRCRQGIAFLYNLTQVQVFVEAHRCLFHKESGDYFHTLRLMEAILEAAPNSLVQLYALLHWPALRPVPDVASRLLRISVAIAFTSVSLSFAMFEQKVQARATGGYVLSTAMMRFFEIASRISTLALFATLNYPSGLWCILLVDYAIVVCLTMKHKSVRSSYSLFLAVPLVLMSYEPLVWRREDHVVPKDRYYIVRGLEFLVMWAFIWQQQDAAKDLTSPLHPIVDSYAWSHMCVVSWTSAIGFCMVFPFVYRIARKHELSRDGMSSVGDFDSLEQGEHFFSESDGSEEERSHSDQEDEDDAKEQLLPGPRAQREADEGAMAKE